MGWLWQVIEVLVVLFIIAAGLYAVERERRLVKKAIAEVFPDFVAIRELEEQGYPGLTKYRVLTQTKEFDVFLRRKSNGYVVVSVQGY